MAEVPIQWREPERFVSGDTLLFQRNLPDYLPSDGWAIRLTVTQNLQPNAGPAIMVQALSAPDVTNKFHCFNVPNFCAGLMAGTYVLSEELFNAGGNLPLGIAAGEKHQIYVRPDFKIQDDLDAGGVTDSQETEAQEMIRLLKVQYQTLIGRIYQETDVQRNRFMLKQQEKILEDLKYWKEVRINEIQRERVRNGRSPGNVSAAVFAIGA